MANVAISNMTAEFTGGGTQTAVKMNVTDTSSAADSKLIDLQVDGSSQFLVEKDGYLECSNLTSTGIDDNATSTAITIDSSENVGVKTASPNAPLETNGEARFTRSGVSSQYVRAYGDGSANYIESEGLKSLIIRTNSGTDGALQLRTEDAQPLQMYTDGSERTRIDISGNVLVGTTSSPASAAQALVIQNGTAPTGSVTNSVVLYAEDVDSSSELKVRDEAGNVTVLSPHNFDLIPEGPSEDMAWSYYSERDGKRINIDMLRAIRVLEQLSGEKLVYEE